MKMSSSNADVGKFTSTGGSQSNDSESDDDDAKLLSPCHFSSPQNGSSARLLSHEDNEKRLHQIIADASSAKATMSSALGSSSGQKLAPMFLPRRSKESCSLPSVVSPPPSKRASHQSKAVKRPSPKKKQKSGEGDVRLLRSLFDGLDEGLDPNFTYDLDGPGFDVPRVFDQSYLEGYDSDQLERIAKGEEQIANWEKGSDNRMPSVNSFVAPVCGCRLKGSTKFARCKVRKTYRYDPEVVKRGGEYRFKWATVPEHLGGRLRSYVCASFGLNLDVNTGETTYYRKSHVEPSKTFCKPHMIDVGRFDEKRNLTGFFLSSGMKDHFRSPQGKKVGQKKKKNKKVSTKSDGESGGEEGGESDGSVE